MKTIITHSAAETLVFASRILRSLKGDNVLGLHGDLGSGKTTFSQGIGKALGIAHRMISPTFVVIRNYDLRTKNNEFPFRNFYHVDLYRIEKPEEVINLGLLDFIKDPANLVIIEWAEKMGKYLPEKRVDITFEYISEEKRKITTENY